MAQMRLQTIRKERIAIAMMMMLVVIAIFG